MAQYRPIESGDLNKETDGHEMQPMSQQSTQGQSALPAVHQLPPYIGYSPAPAAFQQASNNNVVVATQPTAMPAVTIVNPQLKPKPTVMIVTIILTVACLVQGCWPAFVCMVPALIAAVVGYALSDSVSAEQRHTARAFHAVAVCCNIASAVYYVMAALSLIITMAIVFGTANSYHDCCSSGDCRCY